MRRLLHQASISLLRPTSARRFHSALGGTASSHLSSTADESDFVEDEPQPTVSSSSTMLGTMRTPSILGVIRDPVELSTERSRLGLPIERDGAPAARDNSRALITLDDINEKIARYDAESDASKRDGAAKSEFHQEAEAEMKSTLPFDDEEFAETVLAMEVEGALDEAWQDSRKAHLEDVKEIVGILKEMRVRDIAAIDVSQKTSSFDYIVNGTCEGARHVHLAAWAVSEADKKRRIAKNPRQKSDHLWEVVPVGRIVVNLMQESYRTEVNLERKWAVTKSMDPLQFAQAPVSEGRHSRAHGLWTLTLNLQDLEDFEVDYCKDVLLAQR